MLPGYQKQAECHQMKMSIRPCFLISAAGLAESALVETSHCLLCEFLIPRNLWSKVDPALHDNKGMIIVFGWLNQNSLQIISFFPTTQFKFWIKKQNYNKCSLFFPFNFKWPEPHASWWFHLKMPQKATEFWLSSCPVMRYTSQKWNSKS